MKLWPLALYRVSGESMKPTLVPGDVVVGWRWYKPRVGHVAVIEFDRPRIKRIKQLLDNGTRVWVEGDNPDHSSDSRDIGALPTDRVVARVLFKL